MPDLHSVAVADRFHVGGGGRRCVAAGPDPLDHATQIAVADGLAALARGDDLAVHALELGVRDAQAEAVAALLDSVPAGVAAEHQARRRLADVLRPHDLIGPRILDDAV